MTEQSREALTVEEAQKRLREWHSLADTDQMKEWLEQLSMLLFKLSTRPAAVDVDLSTWLNSVRNIKACLKAHHESCISLQVDWDEDYVGFLLAKLRGQALAGVAQKGDGVADFAAGVEEMITWEHAGGDGWWKGWAMLKAAFRKHGFTHNAPWFQDETEALTAAPQGDE